MSRELIWVGSSRKALLEMPEEVKREFGFVLRAVQNGDEHSSIKSWSGQPGVYEIRVNDPDSTFRTVYVTNLSTGLYVLHAFQKKSSTGIKTSQRDKDMVASRLAEAKRIHTQLTADRGDPVGTTKKEK